MERDVKTINEKLREIQKEWFEEICSMWIAQGGCHDIEKWVKKHYGKNAHYSFSQPFFSGVLYYKDNNPLVMFVGQETNGWGDINDFDINGKKEWDIEKSQKYTIDFLEEMKKSLNKSVFWKFILELQGKYSFNVCWNNLDKIHYTVKNAKINGNEYNEIKCVKLYAKDEKFLNRTVKDNKTLLQWELEEIKPDLVVFLTGPTYEKSMETALCVKGLNVPTQTHLVQEFSFNNIPCVWTYHPSYLNRYEDVNKKVIDKIICKIKQIKADNT